MRSAIAVSRAGTRLTIRYEDAPIATGGEGDVHIVEGSLPALRGTLIKVYRDLSRAAARLNKIDSLIRNPPPVVTHLQANTGSNEPLLAWPTHLVYNSRGQFIGFIMPRVEHAIQLQELCSTSNRVEARHGATWRRFKYQSTGSPALRLKLARNLAAALNSVHESGRYVLVDLKPANVLVRANGLLTLVDVDSVQVTENGLLLHRGPVATPPYTPPEGQRLQNIASAPLGATWDLFSFAVIVYELLLGIHPFTGHSIDRQTGCDLTTPEEKIERGYFANGRERGAFRLIPPPHARFNRLPHELRRLFLRCFDDGHANAAARPSAADWYVAISRILGTGKVSLPKAAVPKSSNASRRTRVRPPLVTTAYTQSSYVPPPQSGPTFAPRPANAASPGTWSAGATVAPPTVQPARRPIGPAKAFGWAGALVFVALWLQSLANSGETDRPLRSQPVAAQTTLPPEARLDNPDTPPLATANPTVETAVRLGEIATDSGSNNTDNHEDSAQAVDESMLCAPIRICVYKLESENSLAFGVLTSDSVAGWRSTEFGYQIVLADGRHGFIRSDQLTRFAHLPSSPVPRVTIPE